MKIIVNKMPVDFQLELEQTAGDVVQAVTDWLTTNGYTLDRVRVNGRETTDLETTAPDANDWREKPVHEVEEVDISASSMYQEQIERLETLISYVSLLRRVMLDGTDDQVKAVLEELPYVIEGIQRVTPDLAGLLEEPIQGLAAGAVPDPDHRHLVVARAEEVGRLLENRQREILDPEHEMALTLTVLDDLLPEFENIPEQLQTGQEKTAMATVARFSEIAGRLLRILPRVVQVRPELQTETIEGRTLTTAMTEIHDLLSELEGALRNSDFVLVGDLLEYEMLPRFSALSGSVGTHLRRPR